MGTVLVTRDTLWRIKVTSLVILAGYGAFIGIYAWAYHMGVLG